LDLQYIDGSQSKTLLTAPSGALLRVNAKISYVRVAPGIGYRVFRGNVYGVPVSADARAGFAYFTHTQTLKGEGSLTGEVSNDGDFIQPWLGGRVDIVPAPRWRIEIGALGQGLGVDGGSWGWGASIIGSYAFNRWGAVDAGFRALSTDRTQGSRGTPDADKRSLSITAYGPIIGVSFRF
jgi:hypothetical protein